MTATDIVVAGGGPGGCAAALALVRTGRQVVLVSPQLVPDRGLSGEWLHPAGVAALQRLGVRLNGEDFIAGRGFVLHPGPGRRPITLAYPQGVAMSVRHHVLVDRLQQALTTHPGVTLLIGDRLTAAPEDGIAVTTHGAFHARLVVGADGRSSLVRRALYTAEPPAPVLSATAGFELTAGQLPVEGYGHIFLGGPGPVLAYRIASDTIRLLLDVPPVRRPPAETLAYLRHHYSAVLPDQLRMAFVESVRGGNGMRWAANKFRRRRHFGHARRALVGDAVGFGHPLAAQGMTAAILDGECLARHGSVASYAQERRARSRTAEQLGMALHRVLTDTGSALLRESMFHLWQSNDNARDRMMRLLAVQEDRRTQFAASVAQVAATALRHTGHVDTSNPGGVDSRRINAAAHLANWLVWLYRPAPWIPPPQT